MASRFGYEATPFVAQRVRIGATAAREKERFRVRHR